MGAHVFEGLLRELPKLGERVTYKIRGRKIDLYMEDGCKAVIDLKDQPVDPVALVADLRDRVLPEYRRQRVPR